MRLLFVSNLFPNAREPTRGMHNAQQVAALSKLCQVKVIAPTDTAMSDEMRDGVPVTHPRFFHVPLLSRPFNGWLFARAVEPAIRNSQFDIALVNWAYPDAYGVMLVAGRLQFPFATTVQGSDVNVFFANPTRKKQILRALRASRAVFCRSEALRQKLRAEGIEATTVYNGIDREKFRPLDRAECCRKLGLDPGRQRVLYVGNLLPVKGPTVLAAAAKQIGDAEVIFIGTGTQADAIAAVAQASRLLPAVDRAANEPPVTAKNRRDACPTIRLVGARPHDEIPVWMNASDVLCLPSLNEGLPNVALEAMACGLPVVASRVGGVPEIVRDGENGLLVPPGKADALAVALKQALAKNWDREAIRASVAKFDWDVNARTVLAVLERIAAK